MGERLVSDLLDEITQNELPIYLIHLPEMTLMRRGAVKNFIMPAIEEAASRIDISNRNERTIRELINERMKYAIFSHRWLDYGEPTFQDMSKGERPSGPGFEKLAHFCEIATGFGCGWAWSDTCCIDKSSSMDLEESIRAMFNWYRNAHICIAYLADTVGDKDLPQDVWFTRGWTLQELLAPKQIKLFNKHWTPLTNTANDRGDDDLMRKIMHITGIPIDDLKSFTPGAYKVREKMVWASKRRTTRIEDTAYCLIGIFGLSLTIAYGEGRRAFFRLQEEIVRYSSDVGLFIWEGQPSAFNTAMAAGPECFVPEMHSVKRPVLHAGDRSFALTNQGLRIKLALYEIAKVYDMHSEGNSDVNRFRVEILGLPDVVVERKKTDEYARMMMIGILDFNAIDAETESALSSLSAQVITRAAWRTKVPSRSPPESSQVLYTAILLSRPLARDLGPHGFQRVSTENLIHVKYPLAGWNTFESVYLT